MLKMKKRYEPTSPSSADFYQNSRTQTPSFIQQQQQQQQQSGSSGQNYQQFIHQQQHQPHHLQYEQQQAQQQFQQQQHHSYEHQQQTRALQQSSFFNQAPVQKSRAQSPLSVNVNMSQDYDSFLNASNTPSATQKLAMRPVKPVTKPITPAPGFNITPQQIVRPKKKEDAKDL